jgi:radical SAM protein with 4Fe4S-binding SPASM domain
MTIIICPTEQCNFKCTYCFEPETQRASSEIPYNFSAIKRSLLKEWKGPYNGSDVSIHGGECLLIDTAELEKLLKLVYELPWERKDGSMTTKGATSIVTNGSLITDDHILLFKKYNTYVGISKDGPTELNVCRGPNPSSSEVTEEYNKKLWLTMQKLRKNGIRVSMMCMLHKKNASTPEQLKRLGGWLLSLKKLGITGGRLNPIYSDTHPELELSNDELYRAWNYFYRVNKRYELTWNPLNEMRKNLLGVLRPRATVFYPSPCFMNRCNLFRTHTLSILPDGTVGNCDRTFAHGMYCRSRDKGGSGRYEVLPQTDCRGCRYWRVCGGGCPETGIAGDWRSKTRFCEAIQKIYGYIAKDLRAEDPLIELTIDGEVEVLPEIGNMPHGDDPHGDDEHGDVPHGDEGHGNVGHGNIPHADSNFGDDADWQ